MRSGGMGGFMGMSRGNYPYVTARVKGKSRNLLPPDIYPRLMKMEQAQIARLLAETTYRREMEDIALEHRGYPGAEMIEHALNLNLARTYRDILGYCKGELRDRVADYLAWWDVRNLKTVMRGIRHSIPVDEVRSALVPAGALDMDKMDKLLESGDLREMLGRLGGTGLPAPPGNVLAALEGDGNLQAAEDFYDRWYYAKLLDGIRGRSRPMRIYREFVQTRVDVLNAGNLMECIIEGMGPAEIMGYMVDGGARLSPERLRELAGQKPDAALSGIKEALGSDLGGVSAGEGANRISMMLGVYLMDKADRLTRTYPLSILPVLGYMLRKKREVDNIRLIVRGRAAGLDDDTIRRLLPI